jgi:23S rRNA (cytidine1920-2'-O)/16S rRNA (cytidine1409-2'-O)-methyltransferase
MQGRVAVDGTIVVKAGTPTSMEAEVIVDIQEPKFVSRAGFKLEKALDYFSIDVQGLVVLDAGLSTGGFTDCLLSRGAMRVYGIDVGYGQVHEKIRHDPRVVVMERTNLRDIRDVGEPVDLVTLDLSFISLLKVLDAVCGVLKGGGALVALIKPQFEAQRHEVGRGGIIKDPVIHQEVIKRVTQGIADYGFDIHGVIESPIEGSMGNKEFLVYGTYRAK